MKVLTVSLIIFFIVLAVSILVGFSDFSSARRSIPVLNTAPSSTFDEIPQNMPSGLRILGESSD